MIPITRTSASTRNLVEYWNEARLRVSAAKSSSVRPAPGIVPWRTALEDVLKVGYGIQTQPRFLSGAWQEVRWRTTPSAGALYPFEVIATVVGEGSYRWDVEKGRLIPYDAPVLLREHLADAGFVTRPRHRVEALLTLVARPFQSMKKYFLRGYTYCHLDVGHTATNLALYTAALGHDPIVHLRFSRQLLVDHLKLDGLCREPLAVLSFATTEAAVDASPDAAPGAEAQSRAVGLELPGEREISNWETLQGLLSFDFELQPPHPPAGASLLRRVELAPDAFVPLPDARPPLSAAGAWRSAILGRRSAKGFRAEPVTLDQIGDLLGALRGEGLTADCSLEGAMQLGVRVVARNVEGLAGVFSYVPAGHALHRIDDQAGDPRPACMQQGLAGNAAALLIFHAPVCGLFEQSGYSAFAEMHFRAAEAGQRLHLAATRLDSALGITCIGGFDGEECAALARLEPGEEAVYVILIGISDDSVFKYDRLNVAFSHGHTTTLED
ncbi:MAG TPA: nitroreductase family protein [Thermoanaerobaculia bacterium]|jgi:SagB-type dehydrogenase family enzyme|nr:nitroreductase family protein [Thermoanaerobaculia bacterium]